MRWAGQAERVGEMINSYINLVRKPFGILWHKRGSNFKMYLTLGVIIKAHGMESTSSVQCPLADSCENGNKPGQI